LGPLKTTDEGHGLLIGEAAGQGLFGANAVSGVLTGVKSGGTISFDFNLSVIWLLKSYMRPKKPSTFRRFSGFFRFFGFF
jgi:hypothetical protein